MNGQNLFVLMLILPFEISFAMGNVLNPRTSFTGGEIIKRVCRISVYNVECLFKGHRVHCAMFV